MAAVRGAACLLVTNIFPPAVGGSSEVYAALAASAQGNIAVLTSSHDHETGRERPYWKAFDRNALYPIHRVKCVRPFLGARGFFYRLHEAATAMMLAGTVLRLALRYRVRAICIADDETVGWLTVLAKYLLGRRVLIYCHGDDLRCADELVPRRSRWFRLADRIVAASHYAGDLLTARFAVPASKVAVIQNGVDLMAFRPQPAPASFLRQHGAEGRRVLLTVSRLVPRKGIDKVLQALPAIAGKFPDVLYLIAGDGPGRRDLQQMAEGLGVAHLVCFAGAVEHARTPDFYNAAELVLLPNREEAGEADGLPLVFLEANACGKPVIGGRVGGTPEIVRDGENGVLVDGRNTGEIADAVCGLLGDESGRKAMGERALRMAQDFGWPARAQHFLDACEGGKS